MTSMTHSHTFTQRARTLSLGLCAIALTTLSACSTLTPVQRSEKPYFNMEGRMAVDLPRSPEKGSSGKIRWDELFYRLFGMDMPIANLRDWIGTPNRPLTKVRDENGWHVVVTDTFANNPNLAKRIEVSRSQPEPMTLTLGIDNRSDLKDSDSTPTEQEIDLDQLLPPGAQEKTIAPAQPTVKKAVKKP